MGFMAPLGKRQILFLLLCTLLLLPVLTAYGATGIIVARNDAFDSIRSQLSENRAQEVAGRRFVSGFYKDHGVILAYSPMGKVNNAITTQMLLSRFEIDRVISIAPAGGVGERVEIGSVILASEVYQHDFGTIKPYGFIWGKVPDGTGWDDAGYNRHLAAPEELQKRLESAFGKRFFLGPIVSGDQLIASREKRAWLREKFAALAVDMSAAAVVQTCFANGIPCQIIRVITDQADESARSDFEASFIPGSREPDYHFLFKTLMPPEF